MKVQRSGSILMILTGICCLFALSITLAQPAQGAQEKPLILKVAIFTPAGITYTKANCWILEEIEKRSKGRIKFEYYFSASLLPAKETVSGLKTGVADIAIASGAYEPGKLPSQHGDQPPDDGHAFLFLGHGHCRHRPDPRVQGGIG